MLNQSKNRNKDIWNKCNNWNKIMRSNKSY